MSINKPIYDDLEGVIDDEYSFDITLETNQSLKKIKRFFRTKQKQFVGIDYHTTALILLGGKCVWPDCGCTDPDINTIDHVFNDGKLERGKDIARKVIVDYRAGMDVSFRYQVLCFSHNRKKYKLNLKRKKEGTPLLTKIYP